MRRLLFIVLLFHALAAGAAQRSVAHFVDPVGDDHGDGSLVYPLRGDFQSGDLDLTTLRLVRVGDVYRFEASFRNPIRDPATVAALGGPESMAEFARLGFYNFNLDIYLDQDRVHGSGNTATLPGRKVRIDESSAWERAIILTPRPELLRSQLIDALVADDRSRDRAGIAASVDRSIHFVARASVRGRTVSFEVPSDFLAADRPDSDWALVAFVTGAMLRIDAELSLFGRRGSALERLPLGVMQPTAGSPRDTFGYRGDRLPAPVVDLLSPTAQQRTLMANSALVALPLSAPGSESVRGPQAVAPAAPAAVATPGAGSAPPAPGQGDATVAPRTLQRLLQPERPGSAPAAPARASTAERLRALKELFDQKLIDEAEYRQQRQRILNEL